MIKKKQTGLDKYIKQLIEYFQPRMGLQEYHIICKFVERVSVPQGIPKMGEVNNGLGFSAEVDIDYVYFTMDISLSKSKLMLKWKAMDYYWIASTLVHEMAHAYTEQMYVMLWHTKNKMTKMEKEMLRVMNESTVERISIMILSNHHQEAWMPKFNK